VPQDLYSPIRQDAVLLNRAAANPAAREFLAYLRSDDVLTVIRSFGYDAGLSDDTEDDAKE
jgi:molybdate transport system substrate-binding protein